MDDNDRTQKAMELYQFLSDYGVLHYDKFDKKYPEYYQWKNTHIHSHLLDYLYIKYID